MASCALALAYPFAKQAWEVQKKLQSFSEVSAGEPGGRSWQVPGRTRDNSGFIDRQRVLRGRTLVHMGSLTPKAVDTACRLSCAIASATAPIVGVGPYQSSTWSAVTEVTTRRGGRHPPLYLPLACLRTTRGRARGMPKP
uniref:Uncharacterized protein n=1 Tax=Hyaloperonospora arabidopsidis (strain Emoy2) TaxID=559515 RepID=M4BSD2_HYAAE